MTVHLKATEKDNPTHTHMAQIVIVNTNTPLPEATFPNALENHTEQNAHTSNTHNDLASTFHFEIFFYSPFL